MNMWNQFNDDPRKSYYLFLRQGYRLSAHAAHAKVKRIDAMVIALQYDQVAVKTPIRVGLIRYIDTMRRTAESLLRTLCGRSGAVPPAAEEWLASRFSHVSLHSRFDFDLRKRCLEPSQVVAERRRVAAATPRSFVGDGEHFLR
jgi:hypothetical protein